MQQQQKKTHTRTMEVDLFKSVADDVDILINLSLQRNFSSIFFSFWILLWSSAAVVYIHVDMKGKRFTLSLIHVCALKSL